MLNSLLCVAPPDRLAHWQRTLPARSSVVHVERPSAAVSLLAEGQGGFAGAVLDMRAVTPSDVERLREVAPLLPLLAALDGVDTGTINALHTLRCEICCSEPEPDAMSEFVRRACQAGRLSQRDVRSWIQGMVGRRQLRRADLMLIPVVLGEESVEHARERLGFTPEQMTRRMRALCRRCGARTPAGAHRNLLREALLFGRAPLSARALGPRLVTAVA